MKMWMEAPFYQLKLMKYLLQIAQQIILSSKAHHLITQLLIKQKQFVYLMLIILQHLGMLSNNVNNHVHLGDVIISKFVQNLLERQLKDVFVLVMLENIVNILMLPVFSFWSNIISSSFFFFPKTLIHKQIIFSLKRMWVIELFK